MPYLASRQSKIPKSSSSKPKNRLFITLVSLMVAFAILFYIGSTIIGWFVT
ncbi:hypothetical protein [Neorhizobium sp. NCHU2750]|uniref:hypothetical protein n=1 Tax=Neorhizobium sp. NCHU2750 TaxID=1825976 RepID=UPI000EB68467|nr:hypothetical protein NCHU2750_23340 [Neorhizobium sp. NCHU2750]